MESLNSIKCLNYSAEASARLVNSQSFKIIVPYLGKHEQGRLRMTNRRICLDHVAYWTRGIKVSHIQEVKEAQLASYLVKCYRLNTLQVNFNKTVLDNQIQAFTVATTAIGSQITDLELIFTKKSVPTP